MTFNKIVKSLFLILMAAYCLEIFIVLLDIYNEKKRKNYNIEYLSRYNIQFEKRDKFEVYLDLRKEKKNVALAVDPYHFLDDNIKLMPLSSFSNTTTILCNEYGLLSKYKSDRYGFSNPDFEWDNEIKFLILGDAFVHGNCVNNDQTIASNLRNLNGGKGVLNFGFGGNGPLIEYAQLREYLNLIKVKNVIWFYTETDDLTGPGYRDPNRNEGLKAELANPILKNYLTDMNFTQNLAKKQKIIDEMSELKNQEILKIINQSKEYKTKSLILNIIKFSNIKNFFDIKDDAVQLKKDSNQKISDEFKKIILLTSNLLKDKKINFYFVYITDIDRYTIKGFDETKNDYRKVKDFIENNKEIRFIDLHELLFKDKKDEALTLFAKQFKNDYQHYSILGNKLVSEKIFEIIQNF